MSDDLQLPLPVKKWDKLKKICKKILMKASDDFEVLQILSTLGQEISKYVI